MVHAEELMIGDYISLNGVFRKVIILGNNGKIGTSLNGENVVAPDKKYSYIPLTDKVIGMVGFKLSEDCLGFVLSMDMGGYHLTLSTLSNSKDKRYYFHIDNQDFQTVGGCDINYLHELQQILRIPTKLELEVKS